MLCTTHRASSIYAHCSYVPHANRALRQFNMYLNVRPPPYRFRTWLTSPLSVVFPSLHPSTSAEPATSSPLGSMTVPGPRGRTSSPQSNRKSSQQSGPTPIPIPPIPPSSNPRGELIFTSRVDKHFKESYEKYRAAFERRRDEREREREREKEKEDGSEAGGMAWVWSSLVLGNSSAKGRIPSGSGGPGAGNITGRKVSDSNSASEREKEGQGPIRSSTPGSSSTPRSSTPVEVARVAASR